MELDPWLNQKKFSLKLLTSMQSAHPDFIDLESFTSIQPNKIHIDLGKDAIFTKKKKKQEVYLYEEDLGFSFESTTFISSNILMISLLLILPSVVAILCW